MHEKGPVIMKIDEMLHLQRIVAWLGASGKVLGSEELLGLVKDELSKAYRLYN